MTPLEGGKFMDSLIWPRWWKSPGRSLQECRTSPSHSWRMVTLPLPIFPAEKVGIYLSDDQDFPSLRCIPSHFVTPHWRVIAVDPASQAALLPLAVCWLDWGGCFPRTVFQKDATIDTKGHEDGGGHSVFKRLKESWCGQSPEWCKWGWREWLVGARCAGLPCPYHEF